MKVHELPYWKAIREKNFEQRMRIILRELNPIDLFFAYCLALYMVRNKKNVKIKLYEKPLVIIGALEYWRTVNQK